MRNRKKAEVGIASGSKCVLTLKAHFLRRVVSTTKLSNKPKDSDYIFLKRRIELKLFREIFPQDKKK